MVVRALATTLSFSFRLCICFVCVLACMCVCDLFCWQSGSPSCMVVHESAARTVKGFGSKLVSTECSNVLMQISFEPTKLSKVEERGKSQLWVGRRSAQRNWALAPLRLESIPTSAENAVIYVFANVSSGPAWPCIPMQCLFTYELVRTSAPIARRKSTSYAAKTQERAKKKLIRGMENQMEENEMDKTQHNRRRVCDTLLGAACSVRRGSSIG